MMSASTTSAQTSQPSTMTSASTTSAQTSQPSTMTSDSATPTVPTPTQPTPSVATPTQPTPSVATPTQPTPSVATPTQPTPSVATPTQPTPSVATPTQPTPSVATPTQPTPSVATPTQPTPSALVTSTPQPTPMRTVSITSAMTSATPIATTKPPLDLCKNGVLDVGEWCDPSVPEGCYTADNCTDDANNGLRKRAFNDFTPPWMCNKSCECDMTCPGFMDKVNFCAWVDACGVICGDNSTCVIDDCEGKDCIEGEPIEIVDITGCEIEHVEYDIVRFSAFGTLYGPQSAVIVGFDKYQSGDVCGDNIDTCANRIPLSDEGLILDQCMQDPQNRDYNDWTRDVSLIKNGTIELVNYTREFSLTELLDCRRPMPGDVNLVGLERIHESRSLYYGALRTTLVSYVNAKNESVEPELQLSDDVCKFRFTVNGEGVELLCFSLDDVDFKVIWENNVWDEKNCSVKINIRTFIDSAHTRKERETPTLPDTQPVAPSLPQETEPGPATGAPIAPQESGLARRGVEHNDDSLLILLHPNITALNASLPEFMFVNLNADCELTDHGCAQDWVLMPVENFDDTVEIWGQYLIEFWVKGLGYGGNESFILVKSIITLDLEHDCVIEEKEIDLTAECVLSYDIDFEKNISAGDNKTHSFIDCQQIYALCELEVHDTQADYDLWIEDVQVCDKNNPAYEDFKPDDPDNTGCNSPGLKMGDDTFWVLYNGQNFPAFFDGRFLAPNESTALEFPSQSAVCWRVRAFSEQYSIVAVQISWKAVTNRPDQGIADTHVQPEFTHNQQRRSLLMTLDRRDNADYYYGASSGPDYQIECDRETQYYDESIRRCVFYRGYEPDWMRQDDDPWSEDDEDSSEPEQPAPAPAPAPYPQSTREGSHVPKTSRHYQYEQPPAQERDRDHGKHDDDDDDDGLSTGAIVGIIIGVALLLICFIVIVYYECCRENHKTAPYYPPQYSTPVPTQLRVTTTSTAGAGYGGRRKRIGELPLRL